MNAMFPIPNMSAEAATFADTLDGLDVGVYLLDVDGRLIHTNTAGQALLDARDILHEARGQLAACDPVVNHALRHAFTSALDAGGVAVPMTGSDGQRYVAHALPLASGARRRAGAAYAAVAALFVRKVALMVPPRSEVIGKAFRLTPTELRVLLAIVELGGVPEVAAAFGVANTTIRTHVNRLFEKTGAARQADFVKLVAGYATPLRDMGDVR
ncbi:LuxR family transcriptional regulator [Bradyrhizobium sp. WYCCWR 13023]|uniref:LuxR family transcriptional regulator n=1 Tax=Bradyrhizobium zhengyangense TaxID=2911009 RepID=A0A9X1R930_9BRAD|nr:MULTISPECIES: LuxR family transcriptional regulator [Bradyrhizobium]MCG2629587.1 LuxR family transcriptional regulator [Bradyrhizobium zhengyangense]MCG2643919.1 LuxR family transcriptional regulator [Bradyrhizobium zhengyangense]MCG2671108.1 LuxR family transcriptional regulator [Bradyrhizobium zhengyangense]